MPDGPARTAPPTTSTAASPTTATGTGCSAGSTSRTCAWPRCEHLIAAEDAADRALGVRASAELRDLDMDGRHEVLLAEPGQVVTVKPAEGGGIGSWDIRAARHALGAVLRRRPEAYHAGSGARGRGTEAAAGESAARESAARDPARRPTGPATEAAPTSGTDGGGVTSIHELVQVKEAGLAGPPPVRRPRAPVGRWSGSSRRDATPEASPPAASRAGRLPRRRVRGRPPRARPGSLSTRTGDVRRQPVARRPRRSAWPADGATRSSISSSSSTTRATGPRGAAGLELATPPAGRRAATRRRGTRSTASGPPTTARPGAGDHGDRLWQLTGSGSASRHAWSRRRTPGGARSRRSPTRSRASSASTRAAACSSAGRCGWRRARPGRFSRPPGRHGVSRDRAAEEEDGRREVAAGEGVEARA